MKRALLLVSLGAGIALAGQAAPVLAADQEQSTNLTVNVTAGELSLVDVPDITFDELSAGNLSTKEQTVNAQDTPNIDVVDYRGNQDGWTLNVKYGQFEKAGAKDLVEPSLNLQLETKSQKAVATDLGADSVQGITDSTPAPADALNSALAPGQEYLVAATDDTSVGEGYNRFSIKGLSLSLPAQNTFTSGTYTSLADWTLVPNTESPATQTDTTTP